MPRHTLIILSGSRIRFILLSMQVSIIAQEINKVLDKIIDLEWELKEARKSFNKLQKQLEQWVENNNNNH